MSCKYDRETNDYLIDGEPCRHDDYGDPTKHCTARLTCAQHIYSNTETTCARCLGRTRVDIKRIVDLAPLMLPLALGSGVNSEAANLAGPAADYETFSARRRIDRQWIFKRIPERHIAKALVFLLADDDEHHPYNVLTRWEFMLREDYNQQRTDPTSITRAADYLLSILHKVANDEDQDFPLLSREMRKCRDHLENVMANSQKPERGAPCPACRDEAPKRPAPRLVREYGHWCTDDECREQEHYLDNAGDKWNCPRDKAHWWTDDAYQKWATERQDAPATK